MCLAVFKPASVHVPKDELYHGFVSNSQGAGIAVAHAGEIVVSKGYFKWKKFLKHWRLADKMRSPSLIHFRQATHGAVSVENCHPFLFESRQHKYAVIHNGIISGLPFDTKERSDTRIFVEEYLKPIFDQMEDPFASKPLHHCLEQAIGSFSKMVIMRDDGEVVILNEGDGEWKDGVWYSSKYRSNHMMTFNGRSCGGWIDTKYGPQPAGYYSSPGPGYEYTGVHQSISSASTWRQRRPRGC